MTTQPQTLVAIDLSESSATALREAIRINLARDGRLTAIHVIDSRVLEGLAERINLDVDQLAAETEKRLKTFVEGVAGTHAAEIHLHVPHGHPFDEILHAVTDLGASLLVMGAHGNSDDPLRVGVIASKCVRKAPVDVLLVRGDLPHGEKFSKVLVCIDFSDNSKKAACEGIEFAQRDGASVEFLNIYQPLESRAPIVEYLGGATSLVSDHEMMVSARIRLDSFVEPLVEDHPSLDHRIKVIKHGSVPRGIVEHARDGHFDLVVLGTRGRTGIKFLLLGTTAEKVIHESSCSTLTVKPALD